MILSIITINYNNCRGLEKTFESVFTQTFKDFEYIVIDGASSDGSKELIEKYSDKISYWVSEPDKGIYNAMNKGILKANGEYLLFLNSGDVFTDSNILKIAANNLGEHDIVYGNGAMVVEGKTDVQMNIPVKLNLKYFTRASLFHPSSFIRSSLFKRYGLYNEENKIVSDWEFFLKTIVVNNVTTKKIELILAKAEDGGMSRDTKNTDLLWTEIDKGLRRYFSEEQIKKAKAEALAEKQLAKTSAKSERLKRFFNSKLKSIIVNLLPHYFAKRILVPKAIVPVAATAVKPYLKFINKGESILNGRFDVRVDQPLDGKKYVDIGRDCVLNCKIIFESSEGIVKIGNNTFIGASDIICRDRIEFGSNIFVSWDCIFIDNDSHSLNYKDREDDIRQLVEDLRRESPLVEHKNWNTVNAKPIRVEDNAWIGMRCVILKGVTIGQGAIVAAGSVVTKDVPAWTVVGGNPAKVIRQIPEEFIKKITT